jgi:protein phosphatase
VNTTTSCLLDWSACSDLGQRRSNNEDFWGVWTPGEALASVAAGVVPLSGAGLLLAVSDGMGGAEGGEVASHFCITRLAEHLKKRREAADPVDALVKCFAGVHEELFAKAEEEAGLRGMGATLSALWLRPDAAFYCHVGDSRIYHRHDGEWRQVTDDQSVGAGMVRRGEMTEEAVRRLRYRSMLEQVMGGDGAPIDPQAGRIEWTADSRFVLCSDGLYGPLREQLAGGLDAAFGGELAVGAKSLVDAANAAGGPDNITVILARFVPKSST